MFLKCQKICDQFRYFYEILKEIFELFYIFLRGFCTLKCPNSIFFNIKIFFKFKFEICAYTQLKSQKKLPAEKDTIFYLSNVAFSIESLLVFAVSFTPETPNFGTFGGVAHPPEEFLIFLLIFVF